MIVDISKHIIYAPNVGYFECDDLKSLKELTKKILDNADIDKILISKGIDEKWIEQNMRMLLKISQNKNTLLFKVSPNQNINPILGRIVDIIPIKKRKFLLKKQLDTETVIKLIELHALMLS
ncbi:MAG: hypothetical protein QXV06_07880 [Ignisphaera sp.]